MPIGPRMDTATTDTQNVRRTGLLMMVHAMERGCRTALQLLRLLLCGCRSNAGSWRPLKHTGEPLALPVPLSYTPAFATLSNLPPQAAGGLAAPPAAAVS